MQKLPTFLTRYHPIKPVFFGYNTYIFDTHFAHMLPGIQTGMKDDQVENLSIAAVCV